MGILETIVAEKKREIALMAPGPVTEAELHAAVGAAGARRDFLGVLRRVGPGETALIAEVKRASPSAGVICPDFDPVRIARDYETAGATCLSVLTDEKFFRGSLEYLSRIRVAVKLPLLRKDFIIDERQILEAIRWGADAVLLIVAILTDAQLHHLYSLAQEAELAALVEVHDEAELERALALGAELIGVNNRDLKTFKVDLSTTECLAARLAAASNPSRPKPFLVAESGIHTRDDVQRLARCGAQAILVGETLMKEGDIPAKVRELFGRS